MEDDYQSYRREMEQAVSNQTGSSASEVFFAIIPNICSMLLALTFINLLGSRLTRQSKIFLEFITIVIPCVLCCTVLSDKVIGISQIFLIVSSANILFTLAWKPKFTLKLPASLPNKRICFITNFRATTMIITVVCILAVDFECFPSKFMKTEKFGYSLMDSGVGLFMIANALVSPEATGSHKPNGNNHFFRDLSKNVKGCTPLLVLGLARFVSVEFLGYQRHITEYGLHWNFFLTLAFVRLFTGFLAKNLKTKYSLITGLWILVMHEYALSTKGLKEWVMSNAPRDDLFSANREGWVSLPGYVGLYLIGIAIGRQIMTSFNIEDNQLVSNINLWNRKFSIAYTKLMFLPIKLYACANVSLIATFYCEKYFQVSRRLANSGYCAWILTLGSSMLLFVLMIDILLDCLSCRIKERSQSKPNRENRKDDLNEGCFNVVKTLEIFEAVNDNGLIFFLFANVLTGMINLTIKTRRVNESQAVGIILMYMIVNLTLVLLRQSGKQILRAKKNK